MGGDAIAINQTQKSGGGVQRWGKSMKVSNMLSLRGL